jgi:uncharacterized Zn-finger protein
MRPGHLSLAINDSNIQSAKRDKLGVLLLLLDQNLFSFNNPNFVPSSVPSIQKDNLAEVAEVPFDNVFCFKSMEVATSVSPAEAPMEGPKIRFRCLECNLSYSGKTELKRHQQKHNQPDKHKCTIMKCGKTFHRSDAMRAHAKVHERRILKEGRELKKNFGSD